MQVDDFHGLWVLQPFDATIPTKIPYKLPMYIVLYGLREFFLSAQKLVGQCVSETNSFQYQMNKQNLLDYLSRSGTFRIWHCLCLSDKFDLDAEAAPGTRLLRFKPKPRSELCWTAHK